MSRPHKGRTRSRDTSPDAEAVQLSLLRRAAPAKRFQLVRDLTLQAASFSLKAIREANPDLDEAEIRLLFLEHCYGKDLARNVRRRLDPEAGESAP